jgi:hypothetical protein
MKVSGQSHTSVTSFQVKETPAPAEQEPAWAAKPVWLFRRRENFTSLRDHALKAVPQISF